MKQGDIWLISLDPTIGAEIKKTRPAIIVNDDSIGKLPLKIIIPVTEWKNKYGMVPWMIKIEPNEYNGLDKLSTGDCFQIRSVSQERFIRKLGVVSSGVREEIRLGLKLVLSLE